MRRSAWMAAVAAIAMGVAAEGAGAALFCVNKPPCTGGTQVASFKAAVDGANGSGGADRIELGTGTFAYTTSPTASGAAGHGLDITGMGRGQSILQGGGAGSRVLTADHPDTLIHDLTIELQAIDGVDGVMLQGGRLERVDVVGNAGGSSYGVMLNEGADAVDVRSLMQTDGSGGANYAFSIDPVPSDPNELTMVEAASFYPVYASGIGPVVLRRARVQGPYGITARGGAAMDADGVLLRVVPSSSGSMVNAWSSGAVANDTVVDLRHATIVGDGGGDQFAYSMESSSNGRQSRIVARDVLVSGVPKDADMFTSGTATTKLDLAYSTARRAPPETNGPVGSHVVVDGPGLIAPPADPGLNGDFSLKPTSPYVDLGEPGGLSGAQSPVDLLGAPRVVDGNGDGTARRDIGAFEYQPPPPPQTTQTPPATTPPVTLPLPPPAVIARPFAPRLLLALPSSLRLDRRGRLILPVECPRGGAACVGRIQVATAAAIAAQRRRRRFVTIGTVAYRVPAGRRARLVIRVSAKNRALIRRRRALRVVARATAVDGGATRKAFTLRPARRRR